MNSVAVGYLIGGLGNQLFQIFTLISYSIRYNISFLFPKEKFDKNDRKTYWETDIFKNILSCIVENDKIPELPILWEHDLGNQDIPEIKGHFKLHGYFQNEKHFKDNFDKIYNFLEIENTKSKIKEEYKEYFTCENTVSIHFRLGDYKHLSHIHPIIDINYYKKSLEMLSNETQCENFNVLYFYEKEDEFIINNYVKNLKEYILQNSKKNIKFIPIDTNIEDWKQLLLMSCCKHNIIANSSFSWWSAYFNTYKNKKVIYPSIWFSENVNKKSTDMCPKEWIQMN
jgi:hypothetical protein